MSQQREPFHPAGPFVANRPFILSGTAYEYGQPVNVNNIEPRRIRQMYDCRMINVQPNAAPVAPKTAPQAPRKEPVAAVATPAPGKRHQSNPGAFVAVHRGFGKWYVLHPDGETKSGPMTRAEAEAEAKARESAKAAAA